MRPFPESDWRHFETVHDAALERFSRRTVQECADLLGDDRRSAHERFLDIQYLVRERNRQAEAIFGDWRRSAALHQLVGMYRLGLITQDELGGFTRDTQSAVQGVIDLL